MRNSQEARLVVIFQLALYTGIPVTFAINGYLLRKIRIAWLYSFGMLLSGISMTAMMMLDELDITGIGLAGLIMGISYGFFWANRDFLALETTNDQNRNYYYGLETFFYTITAVIVPYMVGVFIGPPKVELVFGKHQPGVSDCDRGGFHSDHHRRDLCEQGALCEPQAGEIHLFPVPRTLE
jgi:YQGE family putative transporter